METTPDDLARTAPPGMLPSDWRDLEDEIEEEAEDIDAAYDEWAQP